MNEEWPPKWRDEDKVDLFVSERMMRIEEMRDWSWDIDPDGDEAAQEGAPRKMGRPKMSEQARRAAAGVHDAAEIVPYIEAILTAYYPDRSLMEIRNRACKIAAQTVNLDDNERWRHFFGAFAGKPRSKATAEKLIKYLSRPRNDRRRIN